MANQDPPNDAVEEGNNSSEKQTIKSESDAGTQEDSSDSLSNYTRIEDESQPESNNKKEVAKANNATQDKSEQVINSGQKPPSAFATFIGNTWALLLAILIFSLTAFLLRYSGVLPFFPKSTAPSSTVTQQPANEFTRNYVLIGIYENKLYFFDQHTNGVFETAYTGSAAISQPTSRGRQDMIVAIDKIIPSPEKKKAAILTTRTKDDNGIYLLDFANFGDEDKFITKWPLEMPSGYQLHTQATAAWSPDGATLAFVAIKETQPDLFIVKPDNQAQRVTYQGKNIGSVTWLDNDHLAFVSDWEGKDQMYTIHRNGGDLKKIAR